MSKPKFISKRKEFQDKNAQFTDILKSSIAIDIERFLKMDSGMPVDTGDMKAETRSFKTESGSYRVEIVKEYAAAQEQGFREVAGQRIEFNNYTTAGTGAHFFRRSIDNIWSKQESYVTRAAQAVGLR